MTGRVFKMFRPAEKKFFLWELSLAPALPRAYNVLQSISKGSESMKICGLQKLAMVDYPGKLAATVFTGGCNLRCPFCHNALLVTQLEENPEEYDPADVLAFLKTRQGLLDGVVISGGEPLMQPGTEDFIRGVRELGFAVKLDTNGTYPEKLQALLDAHLLDYVAMDIKNSPARYGEITGIPGFDLTPVRRSAALLMADGVPFEFRTTLVREFHRQEDLMAIGEWLRGAPRYFLQTFVDSGNLIGEGLHPFTPDEMRGFAEAVRPFFGSVSVRGV
jgi:pyruvate formate lyase activating enzyme